MINMDEINKDTKICKDCKYVNGSTCYHPSNICVDVVYGFDSFRESCYGMRGNENSCGRNGKLFEKSNKKLNESWRDKFGNFLGKIINKL